MSRDSVWTPRWPRSTRFSARGLHVRESILSRHVSERVDEYLPTLGTCNWAPHNMGSYILARSLLPAPLLAPELPRHHNPPLISITEFTLSMMAERKGSLVITSHLRKVTWSFPSSNSNIYVITNMRWDPRHKLQSHTVLHRRVQHKPLSNSIVRRGAWISLTPQ